MEEDFREQAERIMRAEGASEEFIERELTQEAVQCALNNHFSAESMAWALLQ